MVINVRRPLCFISYKHVDAWRWPLSMFSPLTFHIQSQGKRISWMRMSICCIRTSEVTFCRGDWVTCWELWETSPSLCWYSWERSWTGACRMYAHVDEHVCAIKPSICCTVTLHFRHHATSLKLPVVFHIGFTHQPFKLSHFFHSCLLFL